MLVSNKGRQNVHKIMPDEPSESAERWLSQLRLRPRALALDNDRNIPFIDSETEDGSFEWGRRRSLLVEDLETIEEIPHNKFRKSSTFSCDLSSLNHIQKSRWVSII